ncbi:MAG: aminotransferase class III-fold pyridoxal phosphate-dependent enzyme, partial [Myxococcota bacterium]
KLGAQLEAKAHDASEVAAPSRQDFAEERPLSEAQRRLFVLNMRCPPTHRFYHTVTARRLKGVLDEAALQAALDGILARHEPLRTAFEIESLEPLNVKKRVRPARSVPVEVIDLTQESVSDQERAVRVRSDVDFEMPFDLSSGLLVRTTLFKLADEHHVLVIVCHQLAFDAWSREVLLRELEYGYREALQRGPRAMYQDTAPSETELRYDDLVVHEAERQMSEAARARYEAARRRKGEPCAPLAFETDYPRPDIKTFDGLILPLRIPPGLVAQVRALAQTVGVTLYMALFSLYAVWLHAYSRQEQFRIGSSTARRRGKAAEALIGPFNDFLVLPVDLSGDPSFRTLMTRVRRVALDAHTHGDVPFASLVEALEADCDASRTPLFQAMFTYKRFLERPEGRLGELAVEGLHVDWRTGRTDLTLSLLDDGESIVGFLEASADLFDRDRMMVRLRHAQVLLEAAVRRPDAPLSSLPLSAVDALRYDSLSSLSDGEARYLNALKDRHQQRTERSRAMARTHHNMWADGRFVAGYRQALSSTTHPLFVDRAEGGRIYDVDGNAYIDLTMSFGITLFGHQPAFLREALVSEIDRGFALSMPSPRAAEAAERMLRFVPGERVAFLGTRTEAVIVGLRACRAETGRSTIVVFRGSYHGNADEMQTGANPFDPAARPPGVPQALAGDVLVLDYNDPGSL